MRSPLRLALAAALTGLVVISPATAGTLTAATWSQVTNGFSFVRTAAQLGATGSSTATSVGVSLSFPQTTVGFFVAKFGTPGAHQHFSITQGGPQNLTASAGMGGATMGVPGNVLVRAASHNTKGVNQSTFMVVSIQLADVPLSVGVAGQTTGKFPIIGIYHYQTVDFYAWTPGTVSFASLTTLGMALPSVVAMGSFDLTALGGGMVTLVSPSKLSIAGVYSRHTVSLTTLKLHFVPEPGTLLLLAAAGAALALHGARARRH